MTDGGAVKTLKIAEGLALPLDAVTQKIAWLGRTGSGKTYGCKRLVEQMLRATAQVVALDPVGVWAGLRLGPKSFDVPVLGGLYGDIPLEPTAGAVVADLVVDHGASMVLDVSQMLDPDRRRFALAFGARFFQRKKAKPGAVHLVLEECQEFVPQNPADGEQAMLHEFVRIAKLGRNFGIGVSFLSQRPQEVSKKALNQAECVFAFQLTGPQERKALKYWLDDRGAEVDLDKVLPRLKVGEPHVWSPQWLEISKVVKILPIDSLDTSQTPKVGERGPKAPVLKPIDLAALRETMTATIERAKADDPRELRKRIAELEKLLGAKPSAAPAEVERVEVPVFDRPGWLALHEQIGTLFGGAGAELARAKDEAGRALNAYRDKIGSQIALGEGKAKVVHRDVKPSALPPKPVRVNGRASHGPGDAAVGTGGLRRIMIALAQRPQGLTNRQIGVRAGLSSKSGSFATYLSRGRSAGWLEGSGTVRITDAGIAALGAYEPLPTGSALLAHWLGELGQSGAARILKALADVYPKSLSRDDVGAAADLSPASGSFATYLSRLRTLELIEGSSVIQASEELFD